MRKHHRSNKFTMHYIRRMLLLLLALTPLGVCAQTQQSTKTERRSAMTDSVYRLTEVVVRSNQMLGSKFEVRNRTGGGLLYLSGGTRKVWLYRHQPYAQERAGSERV